MIELTAEQRQELDGPTLATARDPQTNQTYVLVRADMYEKMRALIVGISRRAGWDDPKMDDYEVYRKKKT
jgi:hypothetical protein